VKPRPVRITWRSPDDDWEYFWLLKKDKRLVYLQGRDDPVTGGKHEGDKFWVPMADIAEMVEDE
jgi:hypothetical protein